MAVMVSKPAPLFTGASKINDRVLMDWSGVLKDVAVIVAKAEEETAVVLIVADTATTVICAIVRVTKFVDLSKFIPIFIVGSPIESRWIFHVTPGKGVHALKVTMTRGGM